MLAKILLHTGGILFILLLLGSFVFEVYIYLLHRRYSLPSQKVPRYQLISAILLIDIIESIVNCCILVGMAALYSTQYSASMFVVPDL